MNDIGFALAPASSADEIGKLWARLENGGDGSFFVSWTWIGTWLRCLPEYVRPQLLTASRGGATVAAAILVPRRERRRVILNLRQLHFNSTGDPALDCITIEHNGFVGGVEANRALWPAFLRWFARDAEADELLVPGIVDGGIGWMPPDVRLLHAVSTSPAFACELPQGGMDAILARLSSNARQQLRRSLRDCAQMGELRCESARNVEEALEWFDALKALHIASWATRGKRHAFQYPFFETFHRALIECGAPDGSVRLLRTSAGGQALGYLYNFRRRDRIYAYQSGFDAALSDFRPGYVSHALAMAASADEGATTYDFLAGDNRLKRTFGSDACAMCWHRFGRREPGLRIEGAAQAAMRRTARLLRR